MTWNVLAQTPDDASTSQTTRTLSGVGATAGRLLVAVYVSRGGGAPALQSNEWSVLHPWVDSDPEMEVYTKIASGDASDDITVNSAGGRIMIVVIEHDSLTTISKVSDNLTPADPLSLTGTASTAGEALALFGDNTAYTTNHSVDGGYTLGSVLVANSSQPSHPHFTYASKVAAANDDLGVTLNWDLNGHNWIGVLLLAEESGPSASIPNPGLTWGDTVVVSASGFSAAINGIVIVGPANDGPSLDLSFVDNGNGTYSASLPDIDALATSQAANQIGVPFDYEGAELLIAAGTEEIRIPITLAPANPDRLLTYGADLDPATLGQPGYIHSSWVDDDGPLEQGYQVYSATPITWLGNGGVFTADVNPVYIVYDPSELLWKTGEYLEGIDPVITLQGSTSITLEVGQSFVEPGFSASDNVDGDLTSSVQVTNNFNNTQVGSGTVDYSVSDAAGNVATAQRVITFIDNVNANPVFNIDVLIEGVVPPVGTSVVAHAYLAGQLSNEVLPPTIYQTGVNGAITIDEDVFSLGLTYDIYVRLEGNDYGLFKLTQSPVDANA